MDFVVAADLAAIGGEGHGRDMIDPYSLTLLATLGRGNVGANPVDDERSLVSTRHFGHRILKARLDLEIRRG